MKVSVQTVEEREPKLFNCKVSNSLLYLLYKQGCDHEKQIQQWVRMNNYNLAIPIISSVRQLLSF